MINLINKTPHKFTIEMSEEDLGSILVALGFATNVDVVTLKSISGYYDGINIHKDQAEYRKMHDDLYLIYGATCILGNHKSKYKLQWGKMDISCPNCGSDWIGEEIPEDRKDYYSDSYFLRVIGYYSDVLDSVVEYQCPDCGKRFKGTK